MDVFFLKHGVYKLNHWNEYRTVCKNLFFLTTQNTKYTVVPYKYHKAICTHVDSVAEAEKHPKFQIRNHIGWFPNNIARLTCNQCLLQWVTLRTQDTSDPRHFGTGAEVSVRHFGTSAELSGHIGNSAEVSYAPRKTLQHRATLDQTLARRTAVLA